MAGRADHVKIRTYRSPEAEIIVTDVGNCARCGEDHSMVAFKRLTHPCLQFTHWAPCPTNGEPIMMHIVSQEEAFNVRS